MDEFKNKCGVTPALLDVRNRAEIKFTFGNILEKHVRNLHPDLSFIRKDTIQARALEKEAPDEPKLLPKKDDGCVLI